jgi:hypothetical protein
MTPDTPQHPIVPALHRVATGLSVLACVLLIIVLVERFR